MGPDDMNLVRLAKNGRSESDFRLSNLCSWHVKKDRAEAMDEARRKLWVRGMLDPWFVSSFLDPDECESVEAHFDDFGKAYVRNSPIVEGVADELVEKLVHGFTFTGTLDDVDELTGRLVEYQQFGLNEFGIRLYDKPEESIRLLGEQVAPVLR